MEKAQLLLRLPKELKEQIEYLSKKKGLSATGLILIVLDEYIKNKGE